MDSTVVVPRFRGLRIAQTSLEQTTQSPRRYKQAYYTPMYRYAMYIPISRKHLSLLYPERCFFESCEVSKTSEHA